MERVRAALVLAGRTLEFYAGGGGDGGARARAALGEPLEWALKRARAAERVAREMAIAAIKREACPVCGARREWGKHHEGCALAQWMELVEEEADGTG